MDRNSHSERKESIFFRGSDPLNPARNDSMFENLEISTSVPTAGWEWTSKNETKQSNKKRR